MGFLGTLAFGGNYPCPKCHRQRTGIGAARSELVLDAIWDSLFGRLWLLAGAAVQMVLGITMLRTSCKKNPYKKPSFSRYQGTTELANIKNEVLLVPCKAAFVDWEGNP